MQFDSASRRLRLDADAVERLAEAARVTAEASAAPVSPDDPLVRVGALSPAGIPHDALKPALSAVLWPVAKGELLVATPSRGFYHQMWLAPAAVAVLADLGGSDYGPGSESYDLLTLIPEQLPSVIARLADLRPRGSLTQERPSGRVDVPMRLWEDLVELAPTHRDRAAHALAAALASTWPALASALVDTEWRAWVATMTAHRHEQSLFVLDTEEGVVLGAPDGRVLRFEGVRRGELWTALVSLLPPDGSTTG